MADSWFHTAMISHFYSAVYFRSTDELKRAITVILEREMNHRLKGYLVA